MFDQILQLLELVLGRLPAVDLGKARRRAFAKSLMGLHKSLLEISDNGDEILDLLDRYRESDALDYAVLESLLSGQEKLVAKVADMVEEYRYAEILSIKMPYLLPTQLIVEKKSRLSDVRVWLDFRLRYVSMILRHSASIFTEQSPPRQLA